MKTPLLELLRCPFCRVGLADGAGSLACPSCGREFGFDGEIPLMLHPDLPGAPEKLGEVAGWVEKAKQEGWYEPDDAVDAVLPFVRDEFGWDEANWDANAHSLRLLLGRYVEGRRGLRVLEVGAAKAWASRFWLERDCEYVATDILTDPKIGLGRGAFYGDFVRVQADGEHLPFPDRRFDVVYCFATLHHALDLKAMVREMGRVAAPGAVVAGLNEGTRGIRRSPDNPEQEGEKALGINEHVHTIWAYLVAFRRAGLRVRRIERSDGYRPVRWGRYVAMIPKAGPSVATLLQLSKAIYSGASIYARKPA
ncbi:MAG TPA: methyltransferase domain-containing protein [Gaiellaceae bacterium]|nr:methyltransferase domain-containing protein [Gaiellaceae bacterium]